MLLSKTPGPAQQTLPGAARSLLGGAYPERHRLRVKVQFVRLLRPRGGHGDRPRVGEAQEQQKAGAGEEPVAWRGHPGWKPEKADISAFFHKYSKTRGNGGGRF